MPRNDILKTLLQSQTNKEAAFCLNMEEKKKKKDAFFHVETVVTNFNHSTSIS